MISDLLEACREQHGKNAIYLIPASETDAVRTHLGGVPLLPADFDYPTFTGEGTDGVKNRPLSFLAQIDCAEIHALDCDSLLPDHGILSFFYEQESAYWECTPENPGCARVYWFEDIHALRETRLPEDLPADLRVPPVPIRLSQTVELPDYEELMGSPEILRQTGLAFDENNIAMDDTAFYAYMNGRSAYSGNERIKLLGYADLIQGDMKPDIVRSSNPEFSSKPFSELTAEQQAAYNAELDDWILLFQFDSIDWNGFEVMFGDCGRLYFYIRKSDLAKRDFSRIWMVLQCN